ncbi:MAG TPA: hypothetical protein VEY91_13700 [Candidatus Limnocylindria bacterium]|nr:hypothetical protein [Candidatus Limnocylindria bacterium]
MLGGMFIFPITQVVLRLTGRPFALRPENPLGSLAPQIRSSFR